MTNGVERARETNGIRWSADDAQERQTEITKIENAPERLTRACRTVTLVSRFFVATWCRLECYLRQLRWQLVGLGKIESVECRGGWLIRPAESRLCPVGWVNGRSAFSTDLFAFVLHAVWLRHRFIQPSAFKKLTQLNLIPIEYSNTIASNKLFLHDCFFS